MTSLPVSLFSCPNDIQTILKAATCPCIVSGETLATDQGRQPTVCDCLMSGPQAEYFLRQRLREAHGVPTDTLHDVAAAVCCPCCFIMQNHQLVVCQSSAPSSSATMYAPIADI
ncbi:hypothetical protein P9112_001024 [Eukaryota sp. TZLM1-RC]